jgi:hypothetical protein
MAPMIRLTRKGLVIGSDAGDNSGRFHRTEDLVLDIDRRVVERRASLAGYVQDEPVMAESGFGRSYGDTSGQGARVDWFQRAVEMTLLISFTSLTCVYFL